MFPFSMVTGVPSVWTYTLLWIKKCVSPERDTWVMKYHFYSLFLDNCQGLLHPVY